MRGNLGYLDSRLFKLQKISTCEFQGRDNATERDADFRRPGYAAVAYSARTFAFTNRPAFIIYHPDID